MFSSQIKWNIWYDLFIVLLLGSYWLPSTNGLLGLIRKCLCDSALHSVLNFGLGGIALAMGRFLDLHLQGSDASFSRASHLVLCTRIQLPVPDDGLTCRSYWLSCLVSSTIAVRLIQDCWRRTQFQIAVSQCRSRSNLHDWDGQW